MPIYQAWRVSCDGCGESPLYDFDDADALREYLKSAGWYVGDDGTVMCPDCDGENE